MTDRRRIIVIGGGHNGLVAATDLARAGCDVQLLEAGAQVGGMAATREFAPGFNVSCCAHLISLFDTTIAREFDLERHGLRYARRNLRSVGLGVDKEPLVLAGDQVVGGEVDDDDRRELRGYLARMGRFAALLARQHGRTPPRLAFGSLGEAAPAAKLGLDLRRLGRREMREFLRIVTMNIHDLLNERFRSEALKGMLAFEGVIGARLGPRSGNSVFNALHRLGTGDGGAVSYDLPQGGLGALSLALAAAASAAGVRIQCDAVVSEITMHDGRAAGVRLASGEEVRADAVLSTADARTTLLELLGPRHLEIEFTRRVQHTRGQGMAAKLHLALADLPRFTGLPEAEVGERLLIAPDMDYIERAFNPAKYGEFSAEPVMEINIPTVHDRTLAPEGRHVLSAIVQYAPHDLAGGWNERRDAFRERLIDVLERYAPGLRGLVVASEVVSAADLATRHRNSGGHWHHLELSLDQWLMLRPVYGAAQYATPVAGLYLGGAGTHPGGGLMGHAGRNAARALIEDAA
ncbi:MAG: NAD(P)/FAD-dependent oxidoreductase [Steroidobacteraceae bacterium]